MIHFTQDLRERRFVSKQRCLISQSSGRKLGLSHWKWSVFVIGFGWECKLHKKIKADEEAKKGYEGINMGTTYLWINTTDDAVVFAEYMQGTWLPITFCCLVNRIYWSHLRFLAITELILFNTKSQELKKKSWHKKVWHLPKLEGTLFCCQPTKKSL